jgi:ABC-type lipoprotein release transport system permease subunit
VADTAARSRPSYSAERLADAGIPASLLIGVRFAVRDPAGQRVSMVATLTGLVVAVATVVAALTFGTSLDRMISTPERYGWTWNVLIDTSDRGAEAEVVDAVTADRRLVGVTVGARGNVQLDGQPVSGYGFDPRRGHALPTASKGRLPQAPDEIAAGARTLNQLGKGVGDTVRAVTPDGGQVTLRIVGRTALPSLSLDGNQGLGEGVVFTSVGLERLDPSGPSFFLVDLAPGASLAAVQRAYRDVGGVFGPQRPGAIGTYDKVRETPLFLAGLLALLGAGVLVHLLVTSVRGRRRELAVLKTIGFTRRQIATAVAVLATTVVAMALAIGIPLGLVVGHVTWSRFALNIGVVAGVVWPTVAIAIVVAAALVVGNVAAAFPARSAARTRAAVVLRSE